MDSGKDTETKFRAVHKILLENHYDVLMWKQVPERYVLVPLSVLEISTVEEDKKPTIGFLYLILRGMTSLC